jgi:hypothetical protein
VILVAAATTVLAFQVGAQSMIAFTAEGMGFSWLTSTNKD